MQPAPTARPEPPAGQDVPEGRVRLQLANARRRLAQLPVLRSRNEDIRPGFRNYVSELVYDLQVYRGVLDEIDRALVEEPAAVRSEVQRIVAEDEYEGFRQRFDQQLLELERQVQDFTQEEHERHGFFLRKHLSDLIRTSEFHHRTNLRPRGYAGDSQMMRMIYEDAFRGPTLFGRFLHRHPLQTRAGDAVRNRVEIVRDRIALKAREQGPDAGPLRVMSVACGPAWELGTLFARPSDLDRFDVTLLDQDGEALSEALDVVSRLEVAHQGTVRARYVQDSVRTMLRSRDLETRWGRFAFIYSMGLFDYLTAPVARVVLGKLYALLEPGGEVLVGNFHCGDPTRLYMAYWMDWVLLHRTEGEMLALAEGLPGARVELRFEETHSQMFLSVSKPT